MLIPPPRHELLSPLLAAVGLALAITACADSPVSPIPVLERPGLSASLTDDAPSVLSQSLCGGASSPVDYTCWSPGTTITVGYLGLAGAPPAGQIAAAIGSAVFGWNDKLAQGALTGSPRLAAPASGPGAVTVYVAGTATAYCGVTTVRNGKPDSVLITAIGTSVCANKHTGSLAATIRHELAHVLGWDNEHGGSDTRVASFTLDCVTFLPKVAPGDPKFIPPGVCYHEVEPIFRAYAGADLDSAFYARPIIHATNVFPTRIDSIAPQVTQQLSLSAWVWNDAEASPPARTWADHAVSSTNGGVATVSSNGLVTAVASGTVKVRLVPQGTESPPFGATFWTPFRLLGDSVVVHVRAPTPPPPLPLQVIAITFDESPATTPGEHVATAVLSDPSTSETVTWRVISSLSPADTARSSGPTATASVSWNASYRITFIARINNFDTYQDLPVCTTGGQLRPSNSTATKKSSGGGGDPNAVGGC